MTATITPQDVVPGVPTYSPVTGGSDVIPIGPTTFLHFYNDGAVDDVIVLTGSNTGALYDYPCEVATIEAGEELIVGPFDIDAFYPEVLVTHSHPGDVVMAALFIAYESEGCDVTVSTVYPSIETTSTELYIDFTAFTESWIDNTAVIKASACPQPPDSTVVWPIESPASVGWADIGHTDFTVIWCGL
jgi:hypothetical protein